jgi:phosphopantothenoylcysteine decarboxylase/phosphopantothenate--cysteine ligase
MYEAILNHFDDADIIIKAAAVSDYRPSNISNQKIKKSNFDLDIKLTRNPDILYELGKKKKNKILVGFAAETNDLMNNAIKKVNKKNLDFIVANDLSQQGAGFKEETNIVTIIDKKGKIEKFDKMKKDEVADIILDKIVDLLNQE